MRYILASRYRPLLRRFAASRGLVAFDFDGTLAPLVPKPEQAAIRPTTVKLLSRLALRYPCIVVSGRARSDVAARLRSVPLREIVGNHGIEPWNTSPAIEAAVQRWKLALEQPLKRYTGVVLEDKAYSLAVHYRHARRKGTARRAIVRLARGLPEARLVGGIDVVNLLPRGGPNKGWAVQRAMSHFNCDAVLYVGDDDTDEDVFSLADSVLSIRVGRDRESRADYYIRHQKEIERLMRVLIELRQAR